MEPGLIYLTIAYSGFFVALAGYLYRIVRRDAALQASVKALEARAAANTDEGCQLSRFLATLYSHLHSRSGSRRFDD